MSKNETPDISKQQQDEKEIREIFARVRAAHLAPSPYMKTRVLAHVREGRKQSNVLLFWKLLTAGSVLGMVMTGFFGYRLLQKSPSDGLTQQAYVIQIDFNQDDQELVAQAEVELPEDVQFVSSNKDIRAEKTLRLPVEVKSLGRGKLPFVVSSGISGEKFVKVRLLNDKDELVREQVLKLSFAKQGASVVF